MRPRLSITISINSGQQGLEIRFQVYQVCILYGQCGGKGGGWYPEVKQWQ